ncbi:MAG TPA: trehalose-6-phosphate synthase, partial [Xanthomonadales bacterium]|nr:trehalose-6-phosphate synthase [Xanthomonadales bacterium]
MTLAVPPLAVATPGSRPQLDAARGRLVVVSNRVASPDATNTGGLASALLAALRERGGLWFGWNGRIESAPEETSITTSGRVTFATLGMSERANRRYYAGFANGVLWPLLHFRPGLVRFRRVDFDEYLAVNRRFAQRLAPLLRSTDHVWVHDYHLIPLGRELRRLGFRGPIGFFLHTPFPPPE